MFKYQPLSDEELNIKPKLRAGTAAFKVFEATDTDKLGYQLKSKNGNPMLKVTLQITDERGNKGFINDYFISTQPWKIKNLLKAVDRSHWYQSGNLAPSDLKNLIGQCILKEDSTPQYPDAIKIASYIEREKAESVNEPKFEDSSSLDEIPF